MTKVTQQETEKIDKSKWKFFGIKAELCHIAFGIPKLKDLNV